MKAGVRGRPQAPRIRTIKPEFWSDEKLGPLPDRERLVYLALWSMADDEGRLIDSWRAIDGFMYALNGGDSSCREALATLASLGRILRYRSSNGQAIIQIVRWVRHQNIDRPSPSVYEAPPLELLEEAMRAPGSQMSLPLGPETGPGSGLDIYSTNDRRDLAETSMKDHRPDHGSWDQGSVVGWAPARTREAFPVDNPPGVGTLGEDDQGLIPDPPPTGDPDVVDFARGRRRDVEVGSDRQRLLARICRGIELMELEAFLDAYPADKQTRLVDIAQEWLGARTRHSAAAIRTGLVPWAACDRWRRGYAVEAHTFLANELFVRPPPADPAPDTQRPQRRGLSAKDILRQAAAEYAEGT